MYLFSLEELSVTGLICWLGVSLVSVIFFVSFFQEELMELKEEIALYESAAKLGVFLNDAGEKQRVSLGDSYVELGIKKITGTKPRFCRY